MKINFTVPGEPIPQGRPRFTKINGYPRAYDPPKSHEYKNYVKNFAKETMNTNGAEPLQSPLSVQIVAYIGIPKHKSKKFREEAARHVIQPVKKPDVDNVAKSILDAMTGIVYLDDKQIIELNVKKFYDIEPRVEVLVCESC